MGKHKTKILVAVIILAILTIAWFYGGNYPGKEQLSVVSDQLSDAEPQEQWAADSTEQLQVTSRARCLHRAAVNASTQPWSVGSEQLSVVGDPLSVAPEQGAVGEMSQVTAADLTVETEEIEPSADKDKYLTDPTPEGKPIPIEPQDVSMGDSSFTVTLTVRCDMILRNMNLLTKEKHELVPEDGVIFPATAVTAYEGESVFNVLHRTMKQAGIHLTFRNTPIYNSAYIEAINNLYEFDVGELSGWMYCVNGWYPNYGCSRYQLNPGDVIAWNYTCELGRDLGQDWIGGRQEDE